MSGGVVESCWAVFGETEFLLTALLQGEMAHPLYLAGPQFPHLQERKRVKEVIARASSISNTAQSHE